MTLWSSPSIMATLPLSPCHICSTAREYTRSRPERAADTRAIDTRSRCNIQATLCVPDSVRPCRGTGTLTESLTDGKGAATRLVCEIGIERSRGELWVAEAPKARGLQPLARGGGEGWKMSLLERRLHAIARVLGQFTMTVTSGK